MDEIFIPIKDEQEVKLMNPLVWAYVGDCVYELYIRTFLINTTKMKVHELHVKASTYVKASSQAKILKNIENEINSHLLSTSLSFECVILNGGFKIH